MTSWRESSNPQTQDDLDGLLGEALPIAQQFLENSGEFYPYALALTAEGEMRVIAGDPGEGDNPESTAVLGTLYEGLRQEAGAHRAAAVVSDVRIPQSDAIRVELEHSDGQAIMVLLPYRTKKFRRGVEYGEMMAGQGQAQIWVA